MRTSRLVMAILVPGALAAAPMAQAEPIFIKPGQCIQIGTQQVCALTGDTIPVVGHTTQILHLCQYAMHPGAEVSNLKTYAVVQVMMRDDGTKVETALKHYGMNDADKAACNKEADRLNAEAKK